MTPPLEVTIVRPKGRWPVVVGRILGTVLSWFIAAAGIYWLLPYAFSNLEASYWKCLASVLVVRLFIGSADDYRIWSKESRE